MENSQSQNNSLMFNRVAHNYANLGYYPTDDATVLGVTQRLDTRFEKIRIFDPCCGTGKALADIAQHLTECGAKVESHGVELEEGRANDAKKCLTRALQADFDNCFFRAKGVGLLFLNPPYGFGARDQLSTAKQMRLEEKFLKKSWDAMQSGGVCALIVPTQSLQKGFVGYIAAHLDKITVYRAAVDTYNQVVIMGTRPPRLTDITADTVRKQAELISDWANAPMITEPASGVLYEVPAMPDTPFNPINHIIDHKHLSETLPRNKTLWQGFDNRFSGSLTLDKRRPLMPLSNWHTALALAAGQVEGIVEDTNGRRLLVKGATHKRKETKYTEEFDSKGDSIIIATATDRFVPCIRAIDLTQGDNFGRVLTVS